MAAAKKLAVVDDVKKSRWATLRDEALENYEPKAPYVFDGTEPPTSVSAPDTVERMTALVELIDAKGEVEFARLRELIKTVLGDAYAAIWAVIKDDPAEVLFPLIKDISDHFDADPGKGAENLPGGA